MSAGPAASAGRPRRTCVLVAIGVANAADLALTRGAPALDMVLGALVTRLRRLPVQLEVLLRSELDLVAALTLPAGADTEEAVRRVSVALRGLVEVRGEELWPAVTLAARTWANGEAESASLRQVRAALREAMADSPGAVHWVTEPPDDGRVDEIAVVRDLAVALRDEPEQIAVAYQPVRILGSREEVATEALVRWTHPELGPYPAADLVRLAERNGLIGDLGRLVLDRALTDAAAADLPDTFRVHVNVSPVELRDPTYVDWLGAALERHRVEPSMLLLEVTETALMTGERELLPAVLALRGIGVELGIDDFGTGHSSIARLHRIPVETVKVDRSLLVDIATSPEQFDLVRAVLRLLRTTNVRVVAEGVETPVQMAHLRAVGFDHGQGRLLGPPAPWAHSASAPPSRAVRNSAC